MKAYRDIFFHLDAAHGGERDDVRRWCSDRVKWLEVYMIKANQ